MSLALAENPEPQEKLGFPDFPLITNIDGVNFGSHNLNESGDFGVFWSLLSVELHRRVRCLAMDGDLPTDIFSPSFDIR